MFSGLAQPNGSATAPVPSAPAPRPAPRRSSHRSVTIVTLLAAVFTLLIAGYAVVRSISEERTAPAHPGNAPGEPAR